MARAKPALLAFNRGEVSRHALARVDVEHLRLAAETQENFRPSVLGPMSLRPGWQYVGGVNDDLTCRMLPFVFSNSDTALIELTDQVMRVWDITDDVETLITRAAVNTVVTNGDFSSSTGWTLTANGAGAVATITGGKLTLASPASGGLAQAKRSVSVAGGDQNVRHGFRITVDRGPVTFRCGSTDGDDDVVTETALDTGVHSLGFTPTGATVYIQLETISAQFKVVDAIEIEAAGAVELPTSWAEADLRYLNFSQEEGDIIFVACDGQQQRKVERRASDSWSFVLYKSDDGPFGAVNLSDITLTPSTLSGNGTLTASRKLFRAGHVGALFRLFSSGQNVSDSLAAENTFTDAIRVTGVGAVRGFAYAAAGTWAGTVTLQRSFDSESSGFQTVTTFTGNVGTIYTDGLDNSIVWYRLGFETGNYTSGTAELALSYPGGGAAGVCRVTGYTSRTVVDIEVLSPFSSLTATLDWNEGDWSDVLGWPSAVAQFDGRLCWFGRGRCWASGSDALYSFSVDAVGDAAPINRSIGGAGRVNGALALNRLIALREGAETVIRSSNLDTPIAPDSFTFKDCSTKGSARLPAIKIGAEGILVEKSGRRVYALRFLTEKQDYEPFDLTRLNLDIGLPGFVDHVRQVQPDAMVHLPRADGELASCLYEPGEDVLCWWRGKVAATAGGAGVIESAAVLPGTVEDRVYVTVKRVIGGVTKRFIEKAARQDQCLGRPEARLADSHVIYSGAAVTTIGGLSHLEGEQVVVWGWNTVTPFTVTLPDGSVITVGRDLGTFTVSGGQITGLPFAVTDACAGLYYEALFKSAKLAYATVEGTALGQKKQVDALSLILNDTHCMGLQYGQAFDSLDDMPLFEDGAQVDGATVWSHFDEPMESLNGAWDSDSRLCLKAFAPRPCTVAAAAIVVRTSER